MHDVFAFKQQVVMAKKKKTNWKSIFFCVVYVWLPGCHDHATDFSRGGVFRIYALFCYFFWTLIETSLTFLETLGKAQRLLQFLIIHAELFKIFLHFLLVSLQSSLKRFQMRYDVSGVKIYQWKYFKEPEKVALLKTFYFQRYFGGLWSG